MAPCVLFVDEIEKGLAGVSGPAMDSGVSSRLFGHLLSWLNDHTSDVFFVGTCNNMAALPPELSRAERFDGIFFLDLPEQSGQAAIWQQYMAAFGIESQDLPDSSGWTGAEIKACCRLAALLGVSLVEASLNVVPVSRTAVDKIAALRTWADGKCLDANRPGIYQRSDVASSSPRRNLARPSVN
jgi:SpoVK/Ycf46/Vps4 family AAA+-type ATPase